MGPPCEHGGRPSIVLSQLTITELQWGRRVNTAEGGVIHLQALQRVTQLQWGRRVNTAEGSRRR